MAKIYKSEKHGYVLEMWGASTKPVDNEYVRKTDVQTIIDTIESSGNLSQEKVVELLKSLM